MTAEVAGGSHAPSSDGLPSKRTRLRPKDAATLIVLDRTASRTCVLLGRRNPELAFMPGVFVFPGGRVEPDDRRMAASGTLDSRSEAALADRVLRPSATLGRTLALAAVRETFEETGLMIGRRVDTMPRAAVGGPWSRFVDERILPDLSGLTFVGRAITPPGRSRRFDARFFAVDRSAIALTVDGHVGPDRELIELVWVGLDDIGHLDLPRITGTMLGHLQERLASERWSDTPVPFHHVRRGQRVVEHV